jgi:hypothetical protein
MMQRLLAIGLTAVAACGARREVAADCQREAAISASDVERRESWGVILACRGAGDATPWAVFVRGRAGTSAIARQQLSWAEWRRLWADLDAAGWRDLPERCESTPSAPDARVEIHVAVGPDERRSVCDHEDAVRAPILAIGKRAFGRVPASAFRTTYVPEERDLPGRDEALAASTHVAPCDQLIARYRASADRLPIGIGQDLEHTIATRVAMARHAAGDRAAVAELNEECLDDLDAYRETFARYSTWGGGGGPQ